MAHLDVAFSEAREGLKAAAAGRGGGAGPGVDASSGNQAGEEEGGGGASAAAAAALLEQEDDVAVVVEKSVDDDTAGPPPSTAASASFSSASASSAAEEGGAAAIRPFSRPGYVGRAGYQSKRTVRRLPRVFPSSLVMNAQRAEGLFQRHYAKVQQEAQAPAGAETGADAAAGQGDGAKTAAIQGASAAGEQPQPQQQQPQQGLRPRGSRRQQQKELKEQAASVAEQGPGTNGGVAAAGAGQQLQRQDSAVSAALSSPARSAATRATRSRTGKGVMDDWAKIPVTVMTRINKASPELVPVDGVVFVSMEDGRLFKQQGLVFFEGTWEGQKHKCVVPEAELPMMSETHPVFKAEAGRAEEERGKKMEKARHMLELVRSNEEAALDVERKAADRTLELRRAELRERMLERVEDELKELRAELEEAEAIDRLELMRGPTAAEEDEVVVMDEAGASQQQGVAGRRAGAEGDEMAPVAGPLPPSAAAGAAATAADAAPSAAAPAMPPESTGPACAPTVSAPSPVVALEPTTGWGGLEEADPFSLEQPLLAFEALMDGIGGDDDDGGGHGGHCGVGAHLPLLVDEEAEQPLPSAGPTSAASSSSSAAIGAKEESGGSSRAIAAEEEGGGTAREEKKTNGEAASTMLGAAAVASVSDGGAGGGGQQKEGEASMAAPGSENAANLPPTADVHRDEPPEAQPPLKKKRKINAAHLAITTLALAAGIQEGRAVTGLVREAEYEDIHDVFMDKLHPDPDYGEDEDLCLR